MNTPRHDKAAVPLVRCAIYTRKSSEEGLQQEFNSLDAQRESAEAYVRSLKHEGWRCLPERYDDGGYSGGNIDRPALQKLMADIEAKKIDAVTVYKVDRLSRSLLDFARLMQTFEAHGVSFISVTQHFNTATSMGRLILNVLLSFAQFEREIISERTRDKIAATRRKGKWAGGAPLLGYDVDPLTKKLAVNPDEADRVRSIFELFVKKQSLQSVLDELQERHWLNKRWLTRKGRQRGGRPFTKPRLRHLLTNPVFVGQVRYKTELHPGEHQAILDLDVWRRAQTVFAENRERRPRSEVRHDSAALLQGLLRCAACDCAMTPGYAQTRRKRYPYYVCSSACKRGWQTCPSKSLRANDIEQLVVERIRQIGGDPAVAQATLTQVERSVGEHIVHREADVEQLQDQRDQLESDLNNLQAANGAAAEDGVTALQEQLHGLDWRAETVQSELADLRRQLASAPTALRTLAQLDPLWDALAPTQRNRLVRAAVERVSYDGRSGKVVLAFLPTGILQLAAAMTQLAKESTP